MNSAAFHQLISLQHWTEVRPPQQWRIQNYVCHDVTTTVTSLKKQLPVRNQRPVLGLAGCCRYQFFGYLLSKMYWYDLKIKQNEFNVLDIYKQ